MVIKLDFEFIDGILEVTSTGSWEPNKEFHEVLDCLLNRIEEVKPGALLWISNSRKTMGLDMAIKFSMALNKIDDQLFMAYVPNPIDEDYDVRNFTISKKVISRGNVIGDIFYDEKEAREWLKTQMEKNNQL